MVVFISNAQEVKRIEPPSWWVGMETPLQLMVYGQSLSGAKVHCDHPGIQIVKTHTADSQNYLFIDIAVEKTMGPATVKFSLTTTNGRKLAFDYRFDARRDGSSERTSFGPEDVAYLLMPDRFANGDASNDAQKPAKEGVNRLDPYGRHGGDIQGMIDHLDYIRELGATTIWPTPLLWDDEPLVSYHGYACADYYRIDPRFGSNELYRQFVQTAHKQGLKIIKDMVPNHCGTAHWWMQDLPFADWIHQFDTFTRSNYAMLSQSDPHASDYDLNLCTKGWFDTSMPDLNLQNPFMFRYLLQMAVWWIEWADLDGLRIDTFPYSNKEAMAQWTAGILREYPSLNLVAESWYHTAAQIAYWEGGQQNRDGYDSHLPSVMDFLLQDYLCKALLQDSDPLPWGEGLQLIYNVLADDFVYANPNNLLIFADNHDTHRMVELLDDKIEKIKMAYTLLATMRGVPQLYYGDELLLGAADRKKLGHGEERVDMPGGWPQDPQNAFVKEGRSPQQQELFAHVSKLFNWRKTATVIHQGKLTHFFPIDNVYIYFRYTEDELVMVILNNNRLEQPVRWDHYREVLGGYTQGIELLSGKSIRIGETWRIPAQCSAVIHFGKAKGSPHTSR